MKKMNSQYTNHNQSTKNKATNGKYSKSTKINSAKTMKTSNSN